MFINSLHNCTKYKKELEVFMWCLTRIKHVNSIISCDRPVVMLTRTVNTCKWLLMEKANKTMSVSNLLHNFHHKLVVISCNVALCIDRS